MTSSARRAVAAAMLALIVGSTVHAQEPAASGTVAASDDLFTGGTQDAYRLALRAYVWGYPLVRAAQIRQNVTLPNDPFRTRPRTAAGAPINRIGHAQELSTPETRLGVAPNNDTLYSLAWLDLNDGPFVFETPDFGSRYYTFQMGQADSSTDVALGQRTHGHQLPPVFIQGPGQHSAVPKGMVEVRSSQRYLMIAGRILVTGPADLPAVRALQQRMKLRRWQDYAAGRDVPPPVSPQRALSGGEQAASSFPEMLGTVLRDWRPTPDEAPLIRSFARIGLTRRDGFRPDRLSPAVAEALARGVRDGEALVRRKTFVLGTNVAGWSINLAGSQFGRDYLLRAAVAMDQIYVLPAAEALYPNARLDTAGQVLDGRNSYELRFDKDHLPPVDAFWSVTMYYAKGFMVPNPIARYAIGDRTPGLLRDPDGGIRILIQHARPSDSQAVNWLPAPAEPFMLMMRLYRPRPSVQKGTWTPPGIVTLHNNPQR